MLHVWRLIFNDNVNPDDSKVDSEPLQNPAALQTQGCIDIEQPSTKTTIKAPSAPGEGDTAKFSGGYWGGNVE